MQFLQDECNVMMGLDHENVIKLIQGVTEAPIIKPNKETTNNKFFIVLEYA